MSEFQIWVDTIGSDDTNGWTVVESGDIRCYRRILFLPVNLNVKIETQEEKSNHEEQFLSVSEENSCGTQGSDSGAQRLHQGKRNYDEMDKVEVAGRPMRTATRQLDEFPPKKFSDEKRHTGAKFFDAGKIQLPANEILMKSLLSRTCEPTPIENIDGTCPTHPLLIAIHQSERLNNAVISTEVNPFSKKANLRRFIARCNEGPGLTVALQNPFGLIPNGMGSDPLELAVQFFVKRPDLREYVQIERRTECTNPQCNLPITEHFACVKLENLENVSGQIDTYFTETILDCDLCKYVDSAVRISSNPDVLFVAKHPGSIIKPKYVKYPLVLSTPSDVYILSTMAVGVDDPGSNPHVQTLVINATGATKELSASLYSNSRILDTIKLKKQEIAVYNVLYLVYLRYNGPGDPPPERFVSIRFP